MPQSPEKIRAAIAAATRAARAAAQQRIDADAVKLRAALAQLAQDIRAQIAHYASADGTVNAAQIPAIRDFLNGRIRGFLSTYSGLLSDALTAAAVVGSDILRILAPHMPQSALVDDVLRVVRDFRGADGLQLSDRIWRVSNATADTISSAIQNGIIRGQSASQAAREFLAQGLPVPEALAGEIAAGSTNALGRVAVDSILGTDSAGDVSYNLERLLRTEMNRAYTTAYEQSVAAHPDAAGVKFNLSPNHPKADICDLYSKANLYGLGEGVYPAGQCPYPAHPNTLSYITAVFNDEVSDGDRAGQQTWQDWAADQSADVQDAVLGGAAKGAAFRAGTLQPGDLRRSWADIHGGTGAQSPG